MRYLPIILILLLTSCSSYKSEEATPVVTQTAPRPAPMAPPPPPRVGAAMPQEPRVGSTAGEIAEVKVSDKKTTSKLTVVKTSPDPIIAQLFRASMAFVLPETTNITEDIKAQLLIDPSTDDVSKQLTVKGTVTKSTIQISKVAIAKLTAPDFDVVAITPEQQALTTTEPTEWLWELQPKSAGTHDVQLTVTAVIKVDGDKSEHHLKTFEKSVTVQITPMQVIKAWLAKYWQWIVSTLIVPLGVWIYKEKIKKKSS